MSLLLLNGRDRTAVNSKVISSAFVALLKEEFLLDWKGIHGVSHWSRVRRNGLLIAKHNGADTRVVEYFAFIHDSRRQYDAHDPDHGRRAAEFAVNVRDAYVDLDDVTFSLLIEACEGHTHGQFHDDVTIQTCWDADRLDLPRVGIMPDPKRLGTGPARCIAAQMTDSVRW